MPVFQNGLIFSMFLIVFVRVEVEGQDYSCVTCDNGGRCLVTSENPTDTTLTYCSSCQCGSSYSGPCCGTFVDPCATPNVCDSDHICVSFTDGSHVCDCPAGTTGSDCQNDIDPCESDFCRSGANCTVNDMATNGYVCECPEILLQETSGEFCEDYDGQSASSKCTPTYCSNGGICFENGGSQRSCTCQPLTYGPTCQNTNPCFSAATNPCLNMGVCTATSQTGYECGCQDIWTGSTCADYDACNSASDPCRFGTCESTGNGTFVCNCDPGFTGIYCGTNINECLDANGENPCKFNSTCTDGIAEYNCTCVSGTTGDNCEINIDDCGTQGQKTYCNTVDSGAVCNDLLDGYTCTCSAKYTDYNCSMNIHVWEAIQALGGDGMKLTDLIQLLDEMVDQPSLIKDILPFMLSLMPLENQTQMGFDFKDMFSWLSFEGTELSETDVKQWYEPTLGNCFTFNAPYYSNFSIRRAGIGGGFKALLNVRTDEYLSWIDTEGLNVFIHDPAVSIFTESPRFTAEPGTVTSIFSSKIAYKRLDGNYGDCAWDKSRVGSYYYEGAYTTDGCLRSCYQDKVASSCDCYDPRYPMPDNATICSLEMRDCVLNVTEALPDPSKWADCYCPLPCQEAQYMVNYAAGGFSFRECEIISNEELKSECLTVYNDLVRLEVSFPKLSQRLFLETPKMSMLSFISYAGGLLGCMTGISIISLIEFGYLILRLLYACVNDSGTHIRKIDDLVD